MVRALTTLVLAVVLAASGGAPAAQAPASAAPYTVLSREAGRQPLAARMVAGQEMFALDDLARLFGFTFAEDTLAGGLTVTVRGQTIVLTPGQSIASVGGRLVSLPAPPAREGRTWYVPVDFVSSALASVVGTPVELRKPSRLILVGDIRVPRVAGRVEAQPDSARLTLDVAPATPHTVTQDGSRLVIRFQADSLDATLPASTAPDFIQSVRPGEAAGTVAVNLGPRFASFRAGETPGDRGASRIVIDVLSPTPPTDPDPVPEPAPPAEPPPLLDLAPAGAFLAVVPSPPPPPPPRFGRSSSILATAAPKKVRAGPRGRSKSR
jgi:hypothetical protein